MCEKILVKSFPGVSFSLYRTKGISRYFYISPDENYKIHSVEGVMIYIPKGMRYFSARSLAVGVYLAFVRSVKK